MNRPCDHSPRPGKERSLLRRHPWVFEGSVAGGKADAGETVRVEAQRRALPGLGRLQPAVVDPRCAPGASTRPSASTPPSSRAASARRSRCARAWPIASDGVRLVHGEADGLPGLIVDRYGDLLSAQFLSAGVERWKATIADALLAATGAAGLYERSDTSAREREGLRAGVRLAAPPRRGRRLDRSRDPTSTAGASPSTSRTATRPASISTSATTASCSPDSVRHFGFERVLNCYCYTGGFSVAALAGGAAHVTGDRFLGAGARARRRQRRPQRLRRGAARGGRRRRQPDAARAARRATRVRRDRARPAEARADRRPCRARGARLQGHQPPRAACCCAPGGALFTFSCSGGIDADLFHKIVAGAGIDAGVDGFIHARLGAAPDHPMTMNFPGRRVPQGPGHPQALTGAAGKAMRVSNLARRTLKNALTLRTFASLREQALDERVVGRPCRRPGRSSTKSGPGETR